VNETCPAFVFAWLAKSQTPTNDVVMFLNGGPGSSSFLGWFYENVGPWKIQPDLTLAQNEFSWNRKADLIIFDQPFGVGLSWTTNNSVCLPTNTNQSSLQLAGALETIFAMSELNLKGKSVWLFGESYAG
jgi:carboxypeptidase C (cathepsin A)